MNLPTKFDRTKRPDWMNAMDEKQPTGQSSKSKPPQLAPVDVPAFPCIVYIRSVEGSMVARVANLPGIEIRGGNERDLLSKIVPEFKRQVAEWHQADDPIPWIEPVPDPEDGEVKRFIPVHL
ncbi:MAG: hypothetical protein ACR2NZ_07540 [Rubripirellula sp.]